MATGLDRVAGLGMSLLGVLIFVYYTLWVIFLPFLEPGHVLHKAFLPRAYAVIIPIAAGVVLLGLIGVFIAVVLLKSKKSEKKSN
ncbi:dolichol phosphate-mannose biosynthesis regulatory protein [Exaiptasia diaphana]|uniref:Dolichol phosphate-mannose biosynthesis regulatory protein n=1 Tax=Exaiptasia diaphana TaxID=2652724 RepID=A0A913WQR8_EXADI|nr:dolichol phosphate-mannose biosynthesis regulatory protein [Exaiptasia diaphana]KXJ18706.1 Dolichol phosphate-mannose biosynthesis regulatory protein [Exaiptasia diaphana]